MSQPHCFPTDTLRTEAQSLSVPTKATQEKIISKASSLLKTTVSHPTATTFPPYCGQISSSPPSISCSGEGIKEIEKQNVQRLMLTSASTKSGTVSSIILNKEKEKVGTPLSALIPADPSRPVFHLLSSSSGTFLVPVFKAAHTNSRNKTARKSSSGQKQPDLINTIQKSKKSKPQYVLLPPYKGHDSSLKCASEQGNKNAGAILATNNFDASVNIFNSHQQNALKGADASGLCVSQKDSVSAASAKAAPSASTVSALKPISVSHVAKPLKISKSLFSHSAGANRSPANVALVSSTVPLTHQPSTSQGQKLKDLSHETLILKTPGHPGRILQVSIPPSSGHNNDLGNANYNIQKRSVQEDVKSDHSYVFEKLNEIVAPSVPVSGVSLLGNKHYGTHSKSALGEVGKLSQVRALYSKVPLAKGQSTAGVLKKSDFSSERKDSGMSLLNKAHHFSISKSSADTIKQDAGKFLPVENLYSNNAGCVKAPASSSESLMQSLQQLMKTKGSQSFTELPSSVKDRRTESTKTHMLTTCLQTACGSVPVNVISPSLDDDDLDINARTELTYTSQDGSWLPSQFQKRKTTTSKGNAFGYTADSKYKSFVPESEGQDCAKSDLCDDIVDDNYGCEMDDWKKPHANIQDSDLKIESVFSLADAIPHVIQDDGRDSPVDLNESEKQEMEVEEVKVSSTFKLTSSDWKKYCSPCFTVVERLTKEEIKAVNSPEAFPKCSNHCRKRHLDSLCHLNLLTCNNHPNFDCLPSPPSKVAKLQSPDQNPLTSKTKQSKDVKHEIIDCESPTLDGNSTSCVDKEKKNEIKESPCPAMHVFPTQASNSLRQEEQSKEMRKEENLSPPAVREKKRNTGRSTNPLPGNGTAVLPKQKSPHALIVRGTKSRPQAAKLLYSEEPDDVEDLDFGAKLADKGDFSKNESVFDNLAIKLLRSQVEEKRSAMALCKAQRRCWTSKQNIQTKQARTKTALTSAKKSPLQNVTKGLPVTKVTRESTMKKPNLIPSEKTVEENNAFQRFKVHKSKFSKFVIPTPVLSKTAPSTTKSGELSSTTIQAALNSLSSHLAKSGKKIVEENNGLFLIQIDGKPVLVKLSSPNALGSFPKTALPNGENTKKTLTQGVSSKKVEGKSLPVDSNIQKSSPTLNLNWSPNPGPGPRGVSLDPCVAEAQKDKRQKATPSSVQTCGALSSSSSSASALLSGLMALPPSNQSTTSMAKSDTRAVTTPLSYGRVVNKAKAPSSSENATAPLIVGKSNNTVVSHSSRLNITTSLLQGKTPVSGECTSTTSVSVPMSSVSSVAVPTHRLPTTSTSLSGNVSREAQNITQPGGAALQTAMTRPVSATYADENSPFSHLPPNSTLLPQRRVRTSEHISEKERWRKRRLLEAKYPLPPGVVIKCEPDDSSDFPECLQSQSEVSTSVVLQQRSRGETRFEENDQESPLSQIDAGQEVMTHSELNDEPPPLLQETPSGSGHDSGTGNADSDDDMPPVLQPMFSSTSSTTGRPFCEDSPHTPHSVSKASHGVAQSESQSGEAPSASQDSCDDSGIDSTVPSASSSTTSADRFSLPLRPHRPSFQNPKIQHLKELLEKRKLQVEKMKKMSQDELPLDLST
ncbi:uncharacterized protein LOC101857573 [Aplysia californica]|uniref:Uncharacterized protein LOC101857573 n=1 Tax=Aplysia californica TaxID=6500 RepID=A0ABM1A144_APLCA|nr:uncharacterized protein LOC101857573 [Aplysia californica]XP_005099685.1 uncharacterized protein LOC101857573 [Aplysia californica]XP_012938694.1 uncharacterized protein LOC101857573 [Aplysia californica]